jgi:D-3-phosphoglycerate dehydrogenase
MSEDGADGRTDVMAPLILDFLEWLAPKGRPYADVMEAWRTSCPRLTVWEDCVAAGYVARRRIGQGEAVIEVTAAGRQLLSQRGP